MTSWNWINGWEAKKVRLGTLTLTGRSTRGGSEKKERNKGEVRIEIYSKGEQEEWNGKKKKNCVFFALSLYAAFSSFSAAAY